MSDDSFYTFSELCRATGKSAFYVKNIQRAMNLHVPGQDEYSEAYLKFMEKIVALRTLSVPQETVSELFELEKKVLCLLHFDSLTDSPTWYLDACCGEGRKTNMLMLSEVDLDFSIESGAVQHNLNFNNSHPELFKGVEMGEDVRRVLHLYNNLRSEVVDRVEKEKPVLRDALLWAEML